MRFKMLAFSILLGTIVASCGKKSSGSSTAQGSMKLNMRTTGKAPTSLALAAAQTDFRNSAIASGAPLDQRQSTFQVYLQPMLAWIAPEFLLQQLRNVLAVWTATRKRLRNLATELAQIKAAVVLQMFLLMKVHTRRLALNFKFAQK